MNFAKNRLPFRASTLICGVVLAVSFLLAALPSFGGTESGKSAIPDTSYEISAPSGDAGYVSDSVRKACAVYVDGELAGFYADVSAAARSVDEAYAGILAQYGGEYAFAQLASDITYKTDEYPVSLLEKYEDPELPRLTVEFCSYVTETVALKCEVEYRDNADKYEGKETILVKGGDGSAEETYLVVTVDGVEQSRTLVATNVLSEPVNQVIERGVKARKAVADVTPIFIMPYEGGITSEYGTRYLMGGTFHNGVDISGVNNSSECYGAEIHAAGDGVVIKAGWEDGFGRLVIIEHANGMRTYYAHQKKVGCKVGDVVKQGDVIGYIGSTGNSTGPHVHFEIRVPDENGKYYSVDPEPYIINYESYPHR